MGFHIKSLFVQFFSNSTTIQQVAWKKDKCNDNANTKEIETT